MGVLHEKLDLPDAVTDWIAGLDLGDVGCVNVGRHCPEVSHRLPRLQPWGQHALL
ncbi:hypothetical protein [Streptomyces scabiei]|uniref:hypothetical protein n=1 Tax=Streptomyces scabiei TaxID=1930 RepID=UPI0039F55D36